MNTPPVAVQAATPGSTPQVVSLKDAPVNAWVRIAQSKTGWRDQPIFVYAGSIKRFVMASGYQAYGGIVLRHHDTEEFDTHMNHTAVCLVGKIMLPQERPPVTQKIKPPLHSGKLGVACQGSICRSLLAAKAR